MTDNEKAERITALGSIVDLKSDIEDLKEKRNKLLSSLLEALSSIKSNHSGHVIDYETTQFDDIVHKLHSTQYTLMSKIAESNRHAECANASRILTRKISIA